MPEQPDLTYPWWTQWNLAYLPSVFGPVYGGESVQEALYNTIQTWLPTYIKEFNRHLGGDILQIPVDYRYRPEYSTNEREVVAKITVDVPGLDEEPTRTNSGYRSKWNAKILVWVYGTDSWQETQALVNAYSACTRACVLQHPSLMNFAETTTWKNEQYHETAMNGMRTTGVGQIDVVVTLAETVQPFAGPPSPQFTPEGAEPGSMPSLFAYPLPPTVEEAIITVENTLEPIPSDS